jgi:hypothetical protein
MSTVLVPRLATPLGVNWTVVPAPVLILLDIVFQMVIEGKLAA